MLDNLGLVLVHRVFFFFFWCMKDLAAEKSASVQNTLLGQVGLRTSSRTPFEFERDKWSSEVD